MNFLHFRQTLYEMDDKRDQESHIVQTIQDWLYVLCVHRGEDEEEKRVSPVAASNKRQGHLNRWKYGFISVMFNRTLSIQQVFLSAY